MKPWIKTPLVAALLATTAFSATAFAGPHGHGGCGWGKFDAPAVSPEQIKERMAKSFEVKLAKLELALALQPNQKSAWADFKQAMNARGEAFARDIEARRKAEPPKTVLERLDRAENASKERVKQLADTRKAVESFYGKLSATQKTVFDAEAGRLLQPHRDGFARGGRHGGPRGEQPGGQPGKGEPRAPTA